MNRKIRSEANGEATSARRVTTRIAPALDGVEERAEPGQVEVVVEAFAIGLDHDREVGEPADDLEQVLGAEPLEPERGPLRRVGPGHQQGPARVLAEPEAEQGAVAQLVADQRLGPRGGQAREQVERRLVGLRAGGSGSRRRRGGS